MVLGFPGCKEAMLLDHNALTKNISKISKTLDPLPPLLIPARSMIVQLEFPPWIWRAGLLLFQPTMGDDSPVSNSMKQFLMDKGDYSEKKTKPDQKFHKLVSKTLLGRIEAKKKKENKKRLIMDKANDALKKSLVDMAIDDMSKIRKEARERTKAAIEATQKEWKEHGRDLSDPLVEAGVDTFTKMIERQTKEETDDVIKKTEKLAVALGVPGILEIPGVRASTPVVKTEVKALKRVTTKRKLISDLQRRHCIFCDGKGGLSTGGQCPHCFNVDEPPKRKKGPGSMAPLEKKGEGKLMLLAMENGPVDFMLSMGAGDYATLSQSAKNQVDKCMLETVTEGSNQGTLYVIRGGEESLFAYHKGPKLDYYGMVIAAKGDLASCDDPKDAVNVSKPR